MKRLAAILVAVGMVVGAVYLRNRIDDDDQGGGGSRDGDSVLRLLCASELEQLCDAIAEDHHVEVDVEAPGRSADELAALTDGAEPDFDLWLTDAMWPAIVADTRSFGPDADVQVLGETSSVIARSPVVIGVRTRRPAQVTDACGDAVTWACIGRAATQGLTVGLPAPHRGDGLAILAGATAGYFGRTDFATNDFGDDPDFGRWFNALTASSHDANLGDQTPLRAGVAAAGRFGVVGALEADVAALPRSRDVYDPIYPEPVVTSDIVLVPSTGVSVDDRIDELGGADRLADLFAARGWRVEGRDPIDGIDTAIDLPETQNLPRPGVLQALRQRWDD